MMGSLIMVVTYVFIIAVTSLKETLAFLPPQKSLTSLSSQRCNSISKTTSSLFATSTNKPVEITFPTPEEAALMGIRDWPQQFHSKTWSDSISEGSIATRYVLDGKGRLTIDYYDDNNVKQRINSQRVYPGTLVEVDGEANLLWEADDENVGMIILTPGYEEGGKLLIVGGVLAVFCVGLLIGSGGL